MLNIAVVGGFDQVEAEDTTNLEAFCDALGAEIIARGHRLLGAAQTILDQRLADAAAKALAKPGAQEEMIQSWIDKGVKPAHSIGRIMPSARKSWDPGDSVQGVPEPVERADVVILITGFQGTRRAYWWSIAANKAVLPVAYFGGAAEEIFHRELASFDAKYGRRMRKEDFEQLSMLGSDYAAKARRVVALAEDIAHSQNVCVAMSYSKSDDIRTQLENAFDVFEQATQKFDYKCSKVTEKNTEGKITNEIVASLTHAGFVIVDLTEVKPNVMYELGLADGMGKPVIVTAREGTELPFDVKDKPVSFWNPMNLKQLRLDLEERIRPIANRQGKRSL